MQAIQARRATPDTFKGYGTCVQYPASLAVTSESSQYRFWSDLAHYRIEGETEIGLCTVYHQEACEITELEAHLKTPEILIPIDRALVVPLLREGEADEALSAFRIEPGEALVVGEGIWHGACVPVEGESASYFVIFRRGTPREDVCKKPVTPCRLSW